MQWLNSITQRWANWCGDREMEMAIRQHLSGEGYFGQTAKLENVRLVAVARPGWLQVYRFEATARVRQEVSEQDADPEPIDECLYGLVRDDGRRGSEVRCFHNSAARRDLFARWSEGLICLRGAHGLGIST